MNYSNKKKLAPSETIPIFADMTKWICFIGAFIYSVIAKAQENRNYYSLEVSNFYGTVLKHNPDISHLITGHPSGLILSGNRLTFGDNQWDRLYNRPDYGFSFIYQDMDDPNLGDLAGVYLHANFYFFKRWLQLRVAQGIAYADRPYDQNTNFRNVAYGSHILSSTFALLQVKKDNLVGGIGLQAGLGVIHYSNANFKAPNKSTNTLVFNAGITYLLDQHIPNIQPKIKGEVRSKEPLGVGVFIRNGVNESDVVGSGQYPFFTVGAFVDKPLNKKSVVQVGAELFFSEALERFIDFRAVGRFRDGITGDEDAKRVGLFVGHQLRIHKFSILTQLGYYVYYPFDFEGTGYNRLGLKYNLTPNWFTSVTVRSHSAKAEAAELSLGYRF